MMGAILVGVSGKPGGFYEWAKEPGKMQEGDDEETFWRNECKAIYEEWAIQYYKRK
jgi:hypothetical protein